MPPIMVIKLGNVTDFMTEIITWSNEAGRLTGGKVVVLGDLNETITDADRETRSQGVRHSRFIAKLISANFIDTYRTLHPHRGWTCTTPLDQGRVARSRIDFVLTSGFTPNKVMAASHFVSTVRTSHHSLLVDLTCDMMYMNISHHLVLVSQHADRIAGRIKTRSPTPCTNGCLITAFGF